LVAPTKGTIEEKRTSLNTRNKRIQGKGGKSQGNGKEKKETFCEKGKGGKGPGPVWENLEAGQVGKREKRDEKTCLTDRPKCGGKG